MKEKDLRIFGLIWALIFAFFFLKKIFFPLLFLLLSVGFLIISLLRPQLFVQIGFYQNWVKFGNILGRVNGFLISAILFYGIFTPTAFALKLLKKDLLKKKPNPAATSYFIDRDSQPGDMRNQF
ncbi:MAG: hypothetical protein FJX34_02510 [Alphaproteobacteria bacterium]|nr:hypothetical protein [Alphaproteobacteria bacterium]